jgi:Putative translation initiation inhibitor, yjgF family
MRRSVGAPGLERIPVKREEIRAAGGQNHGDVIPQGVTAGPFVFLSALRGVDPATGEVIDDVEGQIRQSFANLRVVLESAGSNLGSVVKVGVYMKHMHTTRPILNRIWHEEFGANERSPARFSVEVRDLGREGDGSEIQLDVIALRNDQT